MAEERKNDIRAKRERDGLTQEKLAALLGISERYVRKIESGSCTVSPELAKKTDAVLELYNPEKKLQILFDYVRIRFPTQDVEHVVNDVIGISIKYMGSDGYAFYGYAAQYTLGDITVMTAGDAGKGVLLELKGRGCRQFETYLQAQKRTWYDFFRQVEEERGVIKRIDLAVNDRSGWLDIPWMAEKCRKGEYCSLFRSYRNYQSGELIRAREEKRELMGNTLYLGSLKSEIYFCIYEKDYEQYVKTGQEPEDAEVKNRFEIRLKGERAKHALEDLLEHEDAGKTAFSIINYYVRFLKRDDAKDRREWELDDKWKLFLAEEDRMIKLTAMPEPYTLERTLNWVTHQVAPSLKMVKKLGECQGEGDIVADIIAAARLSPRHQKILDQQMIGAERMTSERFSGFNPETGELL